LSVDNPERAGNRPARESREPRGAGGPRVCGGPWITYDPGPLRTTVPWFVAESVTAEAARRAMA